VVVIVVVVRESESEREIGEREREKERLAAPSGLSHIASHTYTGSGMLQL
jgi:S-adenosylmethionine/arginine decarboxylase-like enzyme